MSQDALCSVEKAILVTGLPGSGKSIFGSVAAARGIPVINMGDIIRGIARERSLETTDKNLGMIAKEIREKLGNAAVAILALEKACASGSKLVVIEGVRSLEELRYIQEKVSQSVLIAFHSSPRTRFRRLMERGRKDDPKSWEEFKERDHRELSFGIGSVIALADVMIVNENLSITQLSAIVEDALNKILTGDD
ncbi:MAG: AAA family ATPase [Infirmifilum sp.]